MESYFPVPSDGRHSQLARQRVLEDIRALVADGEVMLMATADDLTQAARQARDQLGAMIVRAKDFMIEAQEHPLESARIVIDQTETTVRKHPLASVAVAFGAGLCLGTLLSRRSRD
jgi:ElaB/YqjD/DUF883 family membrane-anchored ribosome-binding protein